MLLIKKCIALFSIEAKVDLYEDGLKNIAVVLSYKAIKRKPRPMISCDGIATAPINNGTILKERGCQKQPLSR